MTPVLYLFFLLRCAVYVAAAPQADLAERQLGCILCPETCLSRASTTTTIFLSGTRACTATAATATATITTTRVVSTVTRTNVSTVTQLATSTRTSTVTRVSTTTATTTTTNTRVVSTVVTSTRLVPTTTTTTSTIRVTGPRTTTSTVTTTVRTCTSGTNTNTDAPTPGVLCTSTINFDQFATLGPEEFPAVPTGDPSTSGLTFVGFVVYSGTDIPPPPSAPNAGAIISWGNNRITRQRPFTLRSVQAYCPPGACNITLFASSTAENGARLQVGSGWFTFNDTNTRESFALAVATREGLGGFSGTFENITAVEITADLVGNTRVAVFDDVVIVAECEA